MAAQVGEARAVGAAEYAPGGLEPAGANPVARPLRRWGPLGPGPLEERGDLLMHGPLYGQPGPQPAQLPQPLPGLPIPSTGTPAMAASRVSLGATPIPTA